MEHLFISDVGDDGKPYFMFNASSIPINDSPENVTGKNDVCTFLSETINITRKATGIFETDLTSSDSNASRDDLILAFLSLALLLVIECILTAVLLRTYRDRISNFSFSIKQFVELAREFKFRYLIHGRSKGRRDAKKPRRIQWKLLFVASLTLLFTSGVEVMVLFLSTPRDVPVTNKVVSFTLVEAVIPDWNEVRRNILSSINRPCTALTFSGVEQRENQISACMASPGLAVSRDTFSTAREVEAVIRTRTHEFGAEHEITIDGQTAQFFARAYFSLGDGRNRIMRKRATSFNKKDAIKLVHMQFIAYLYNYYNFRVSQNERLTIIQLWELEYDFSVETGGVVKIMQLRGTKRFREAASTNYTTIIKGMIPSGGEALRFGQTVLKGSTAIALAGPDENDLEMGSGNTTPRTAVMWYETARILNWLSLLILLASASATLVILRLLLRPIGTAEIAGAFVRETVGADLKRPPILIAKNEKMYFEVPIIERMSDVSLKTTELEDSRESDVFV